MKSEPCWAWEFRGLFAFPDIRVGHPHPCMADGIQYFFSIRIENPSLIF
jgi:hypothetical protein